MPDQDNRIDADINIGRSTDQTSIDTAIHAQKISFGHEETMRDKELQHEKEMTDKKHYHERDMLCTQLGWFGRLFGGKDILPLNISGSLILILLLFASGFIAYSIYSIKDCTNSKIEIQDIWSVVTPIITLALGYLFGSHKNNEV